MLLVCASPCFHQSDTHEAAPVSNVLSFLSFLFSCFFFWELSVLTPPLCCCLLSGPKWIKWIWNRSHSLANSIAWILSNPRWIDSQTKEQQRCKWDAWSALSGSDTYWTLAVCLLKPHYASWCMFLRLAAPYSSRVHFIFYVTVMNTDCALVLFEYCQPFQQSLLRVARV